MPALQGYDYVQDRSLISSDALSIMVRAIEDLELKGENYKQSLREKGRIFSRQKYSTNAVCRQLDEMSAALFAR